jgi:hypothetical protein
MGSGLPFSFESRTIWLDWAGLRGMLYDRAAGFRFFFFAQQQTTACGGLDYLIV